VSLSGLRARAAAQPRRSETHAHADHLTGAAYLKHRLPGAVPICIGADIAQVAHTFAPKYGLDPAECVRGFDRLLHEGDALALGALTLRVMHLPGHTPDHVGYAAGESVFVGDSIFLPDVGSARADFPGGDATALFASMQRLLALPAHVHIYSGHDYPGARRDQSCRATVGDQRAANVHITGGRERFLAFRTERDATLGAPRLLHPSLQVNIRAGRLPPKDADGVSRLKMPVLVEGWDGA
jgi:glyoxylase-like metal-dependent hydrolase (beta-lactamase superfamily II)